ncbi:precorrin-3B C(17)-methyltransferase [Rubellimicrobium aerolatum]|uniref:Precorrin-3B C(17)-methyltransferase n=1 Tax=Rubellimicrobium aerolatum TaxID=490979 RepID=A0ABW0SD39_9RHOB|nr:precorrin-3B C(17)-methyltransferase [Rubellimicrobium aerolatum]MBP1806706.1 cobalt-precorrin 5A hydrolase/precorrin-3B C17-methyltransferase [Rubellimicrobium aerolatum]
MALTPVVVALTPTPVAARVAEALGATLHGRAGRVEAEVTFDDTLDHLRTLFAAGMPVIGVCAAGILIRAVAPLLSDKRTEPPVVAVAEDGSAVVPLLGGHRGANALARRIAEALGVPAAVTTAGDVGLGLALDEPPEGWRLAEPEKAGAVMARLLAGEGARVVGEAAEAAGWLAALPEGDGVTVACTTGRALGADLRFAPQVAALGVGAARGCPPDELAFLVQSVLKEAGIAPEALAAVGTLDLKADEGAVVALARELGVPLRLFGAAELEAEAGRLLTPSEVVFAEVGCHGVSEGAALALAGPEGRLVVAKRKTGNATCALALSPAPVTRLAGRPRGRLSVVGIGPGQAAWRTPEVSRLVAEAEELVGYGLYIDLLGPLAAGKPRAEFPLGGEEDRCRHALERAGEGRDVALVCSGDAGIYAMAALVFELLDRPGAVSDAARRVEVVVSPGISALQAAAARAGAPLGHDFCAVSLSDLLTPREDILRRLRAAAAGDFVVALYNPVSRTRRTLLNDAREILLAERPADTPVLLASNLGRPGERLAYRRLGELRVDEVDMLTVVLIGSSQSRIVERGEGPRLYTPRGYAKKMVTA